MDLDGQVQIQTPLIIINANNLILIVFSTSMIRLFCAIYFDPDRQIWVQGTVDWNQQEPGSTHEFFLGCLCYRCGRTSPDSNTVGSSQHQLFKD